jgi:hypothetical protein
LLNRDFTPAVDAATLQDFGDGIAEGNTTVVIADYRATRQSACFRRCRDYRNYL